MATNTNTKLHTKGPCGSGKYCHLCKSKSWCKLKDSPEAKMQIEVPETEATETASDNYHLAIDIGTTTVAAALVCDGKIVNSIGKINPQIKWGTDVLTRAQAAITNGKEIQQTIETTIKEMAEELCPPETKIQTGVITGNTTMLYLLTGRNPECLTRAPFQADWLGDCHVAIGGINYYIPSCISAFIGADAVCAAMAAGMTEQQDTSLLADIGTNGEILLWHNGKMLCCSTAAGPAFEGFGLSHGMAAVKGAVEHVYTAGGKFIYKVIGDTAAEGLCGSGIIDLLACMKQTGAIQENGALTDEHPMIDSHDINMIQLAKSAVCAGIITAMEKAGIKAENVETLWLAGGFGKNINIQNAANIGLIPFGLSGKIKVLGNGALKGAVMLCQNPELKEKMRNISRKAETIQLTEEDVFTKKFVECMAIRLII